MQQMFNETAIGTALIIVAALVFRGVKSRDGKMVLGLGLAVVAGYGLGHLIAELARVL